MARVERRSAMRATILLAALLLLFISVYEYGRVLHWRPQPMHLWRQGDCLALTLNYARGNGTFLEPEILSRIADKGTTAKSAGELPLIYWGMGRLWSVIGPSEFAYRLFGLLLHMAGTFALFATVRRVVRRDFWAIATALLFFTSPVVVYYGIAFLPDVPAYDLALIGWYAMARFAEGRRHRYWYAAMGCFGLAALLKVTAGMSLVALCALLLVATVRPRWLGAERRLLPDALPGWGAVAVVMTAILAWYVHAEVYNDAHGGRYTFNNLWPIWTMTPAKVDEAWRFAKDVLVFQVFDTTVWCLFGAAFLALLLNLRQVPRALWSLNALLLVGAVAYVVLWFNALLYHDYYFINPQIVLLVLWATFLWWLARHHPDILDARWSRWAMSALVLFNLGYAANNLHMRHNEGGDLTPASLLPVYHDEELPYWNTITYGPLRDLPTITPYLRAHGVKETDPVIFADDPSINASLYLMGQPGFTRFSWELDSAATYDRLIALGARYLIYTDTAWERKPFLRPFLRKPVGRYRDTRIFDLRGLDELTADEHTLTMPQLLAHARRADTISTTNGMARFKGTKVPLQLAALPLDTNGAWSAELRVRGRTDAPLGVHLVYEEKLGERVLVHRAVALARGPFLLDQLIVPHPGPVRRMLRLENPTGAPFTVQDLRLEVRRWHR